MQPPKRVPMRGCWSPRRVGRRTTDSASTSCSASWCTWCRAWPRRSGRRVWRSRRTGSSGLAARHHQRGNRRQQRAWHVPYAGAALSCVQATSAAAWRSGSAASQSTGDGTLARPCNDALNCACGISTAPSARRRVCRRAAARTPPGEAGIVVAAPASDLRLFQRAAWPSRCSMTIPCSCCGLNITISASASTRTLCPGGQ